ncbi:hypothetical protein ACLMJK_001459 [Lecanora helva]
MGNSMELHSVNGHGTVEKSPYTTETEVPSEAQRDVQALARLGKKPILKRRFTFLSILGFTCTILITWEAELIVFTLGLTNGGSAGLIYSYLFSFVGSIALYTTMGELASMAPTSGGQYHWASMLAPEFCKKFVSYIMGWLVICGWQAILAGSAYLGGNMVLALAALNHSNYSPKLWEGTMVYWAVMAVAILINTYTSKILPKLESFILILHIMGFFGILIPLVYMAPEKVSAHDVFTVFENGGGWPTTATSVFVGLLGSVFATYGTDCAMAEEIRNANVVIPWCILSTTLLNGALGFAMVIAVLFVTVDIDRVLASTTGALGFPYMQIFYDATGSLSGATAMICIIIVMDICAAIAFLATSSRIVFAFGRDKGLPFWRTMATVNMPFPPFVSYTNARGIKVQDKSAIPLYAIFVMAGVACAIGLINIGSATAFNDVISVGVSSLYSSYVICEALLLYHRVKGNVRKANEMAGTEWHANELVWGPFHVPGIWGILTNAFAVGYGIIVFIFSFFPTTVAPDAAHMNFAVLMTGAIILFAIIYYYLYANKVYRGPVVEISPYQVQ